MKVAWLPLVSLVALLAPVGCSITRTFRPVPDGMEIPPTFASADELQGRIQAANSITSVNLRDNTLAALATEGATAKQPEFAKQALNGIVSMNLRDTTAADCALRLANAGRTDLGIEFAGLIVSQNLRDQTLGRLAKGR